MSRVFSELIRPSADLAPLARAASDPVPLPRAWYAIAHAHELKPARPLTRELNGIPLVVWRDAEGVARVTAAHCAHVGAHLGHGDVAGGRLRCPLHHWSYDGQGRCRDEHGEPRADYRQRMWPATELGGEIYVHASPQGAAFPTSQTGEHGTPGRPVFLRAPWFAVIANAFDMRHLEMVHRRALLAAPEIERQPDCFRLRVRTRVTGDGIFHRLIRAASGNEVEAEISSFGGPLLHVRSRIGDRTTRLLLSARPTHDGVWMTPVVLSPRGGAREMLRHWIACWGYLEFLRRDIEILDQMRFRPRLTGAEDEVLGQFLDFARSRPAAEIST